MESKLTPRNFVAVPSDFFIKSKAILAKSVTPNYKTSSIMKDLF